MTDFEKYKENIMDYASKNLQKKGGSRIKPKYICPFCGSGSGPHKTAAFTIYPTSFNCFSCGKSGDLFDLVGEVEHLDKAAAIHRVKELYGDGTDMDEQKTIQAKPKAQIQSQNDYKETYAAFYQWATENALKGKYWQGRGFSIEDIKKYKLGEIPKDSIKALADKKTLAKLRITYINYHPSNYGVIPYGPTSFTLRDLDQKAYIKQQKSDTGIFHSENLYTDGPYCLVVEGEVDTLTIETAADLPCVGLGCKGNGQKLLDQLALKPTKKALFLLPDNDRLANGEPDKEKMQAMTNLCDDLKAKGINAVILNNTNWKYKDPNEYYQEKPDSFVEAMTKLCDQARETEEQKSDQEKTDYLKTSAGSSLYSFWQFMINRDQQATVKTGFKVLDKLTDGGLWAGEVTMLGALSSGGKTTLALQMAVNIANSGRDVLYMAMEQGKYDLMARCISSITYELTRNDKEAQTSREVGSWHLRMAVGKTGKKAEIRDNAERLFQDRTRGKLYFFDGRDKKPHGISIEDIKDILAKHIRLTGNKPVIFIDYLQLIRPLDIRVLDKQNIDICMTDLKDIAVEFDIPVVCISSFNRSSYNTDVDMAAFKESGKIEFSSDTVLALQAHGIKKAGNDKERAANKEVNKQNKKKNDREMDLVILKQRSGMTEVNIPMTYHAKFNYFEELGTYE